MCAMSFVACLTAATYQVHNFFGSLAVFRRLGTHQPTQNGLLLLCKSQVSDAWQSFKFGVSAGAYSKESEYKKNYSQTILAHMK